MNKEEILERLGSFCKECYYKNWEDGDPTEPSLTAFKAYELLKDLLEYIKQETCVKGCGERVCKCMAYYNLSQIVQLDKSL